MSYGRRTSAAVLGTAWLVAAAMTGSARNIAGYVRLEVPAGLSMVSVPFEAIGGGELILGDVLARAPEDTQVMFFMPGSGYLRLTKVEGSWFDDLGSDWTNTPLQPGGGFWLNAPSSFGWVLHGQVRQTPVNIQLAAGLQIVSYGFPVTRALSEIGPATSNEDDQLLVFLPGTGYQRFTFVQGVGWIDDAGQMASLTLEPGRAFWYAAQAAITWVQTPNF